MGSYARCVFRIVCMCGWGIATCSFASARQPDFVTRKVFFGEGGRTALTERMRVHSISGIIIHHTAVRQQPHVSLEKKMLPLQSFSQRPGKIGKRIKPAWGDVPYHFYIGVSGHTAAGRNLKYAGDTNTRYDTAGWIQIVVEGDFKTDQPRPAQLTSLPRLTSRLIRRYKIPGSRISGHNDHASTDCPGPNLQRYLPILRE